MASTQLNMLGTEKKTCAKKQKKFLGVCLVSLRMTWNKHLFFAGVDSFIQKSMLFEGRIDLCVGKDNQL